MYWYSRKRCLVRIHPHLVRAGKGSTYRNPGSKTRSVDSQKFIIAAGSEIYLLAGLLGLGIGYLIASRSRLPKYGHPTKVFPYGGRPYTGPWGGIDDYGSMHIGDREFDPDNLGMVGPVKTLEDSRKFIDLRKGFVNPEELKYLKSHNREGFRLRKGLQW